MAKQLPYPVMREIFSRFENSEPEPKGELNHVNAYTLVVAVALSAQATDKGVNKATEALFKTVDTPQKMLDLGEDGLIAHIFRVGNRAGIAPGKTVDQVERAIEDNVPADFQLHAHHWLILHGRYICVARKPKCRACIISDLCQFEEKTQ